MRAICFAAFLMVIVSCSPLAEDVSKAPARVEPPQAEPMRPPITLTDGTPFLGAGERLLIPSDLKREPNSDTVRVDYVIWNSADDPPKALRIKGNGSELLKLRIGKAAKSEGFQLVDEDGDGFFDTHLKTTVAGDTGILWIDQPYVVTDADNKVIYSSPH